MSELDRIDFEIVAALQKDARLSNKELAGQVGLAPSTCLGRVRRLVREGVFLGFHARVDPASLGVGLQAVVSVRMNTHTRTAWDALKAHVLGLPEVVAAYNLAGREDLLIHVAVRDTEHLRRFISDAITSRPEVHQVETNLVFEYFPRSAWPSYRSD